MWGLDMHLKSQTLLEVCIQRSRIYKMFYTSQLCGIYNREVYFYVINEKD